MLEDERWGVGKYDGVMLQDADLPPAVICEPMELVRAAHEAAAEQALHRSRTFQHLVFQQLSEAEADLLVEVEASLMEHRDLGQALRGPLGTLEMALREKLEQHRMQEAEASREALHALASQLRAQHDDQIRKQVVVATFTEQHAEAKLKAARRAAQTRLVEACAVLERQCEARLAEAFHSGWSWKENRRITAGMSMLWDNYQDETPADSDMNVLVPALYVEHSGSSHASEGEFKKFTWIHGLRIEKPSNAGVIIAPRINFKWSPSNTLDFRLNAGRGYRRVHLFTEEHAALDGSRAVLQPTQGLRPESSWNTNLSVAWYTGDDTYSTTVSAHAFTTVFTDRIYADYDSLPNAIVYRNIDGVGWNRGVGMDVIFSGFNGWSSTLGATLLRSQLLEQSDESWSIKEWQMAEDIEFAPNFTANLGLGYRWRDWGVNMSGQHVGVIRLPYYSDDEPDASEPFQLIHLSLHKSWSPKKNTKRSGMMNTLTVGVKNLTNTTQSRPIIASDSPFSEDFDASRIYGPIEQSRLFVKMAWSY